MNNSSYIDDFDMGGVDIEAMWHRVNNAPSDPVSRWILIASFTFALLGTISNLMSMIVLIRLSKQLSTFIYLTGLSLSDIITCISMVMNVAPSFLLQTRRGTSVRIVFEYISIAFGALAAASRVLSFWISTAVTMDRWILICYPIYGKRFCTLNRAKIVTCTLFVIALVYSVPLLFEYEIILVPTVYSTSAFDDESQKVLNEKFYKNTMMVTKGYSDLARRRFYRWSYVFFNIIYVYALPTLMIVFFNIQLIRALHRLKSRTKRLREKHGRNRPSRHQYRSHQSKYSVTIMVITMVLTLLLCRSPTTVIWVLWSFDSTIKSFFTSSSSSSVRRFHNLANLIAIVNAATNFLPFCVFGQLFRAECLTIYCCRRPTSKQLARQARKKYEENPHSSGKNPRGKLLVDMSGANTTRTDYLRAAVSFNSETTSGITSSPNQSSAIYPPTRILRLSDSPIHHSIHRQSQPRIVFTTVPLLEETVNL